MSSASRHSSTDWRRFQDLVAHIERLIEPDGAVVTSPDWVLDLASGVMREVDASIRTKAGSAELLVTLECRKRSDKEDVTWIEQLATKKESIGAACTIAISSAGFSQAAETLAQKKGIELRCLKDVTAEDVTRRLLSGLAITLDLTDFEVSWFSLLAEDGSPMKLADLPEGLLEGLRRDGMNTPFLTHLPSRDAMSMNKLLADAPRPNVPDDGIPVSKVYTGVFGPGVVVMTRAGEKPVGRIQFKVTYRRQAKRVEPLSLHQYVGPRGPIIEVLQGGVELDDKARIGVEVFLSRQNRENATDPREGKQ